MSKQKSTKKQIDEKAEVFRKEAKENLKKAKAELREVEEKVKSYMQKNPAKAAGIAAGIGAVIGAGIVAVIGGKKRKK